MSKKLLVPERRKPAEGAREIRRYAVNGVEIRDATNGMVSPISGAPMLHFSGYASVFDTPYEMYGGPSCGGWLEIVDRTAFTKTLSENPDVQLLVNHRDLPLARTAHRGKPGTMTLSVDDVGLHVDSYLEPTDPDVQRIAPKMARDDLDEMSFAFYTLRQRWNDDETERHMVELGLNRGDVSIVSYGASPTTSATLRTMADGIWQRLSDQRSEDPAVIAASIDSVIDELLAAFDQGDYDQAQALTIAADIATDALLAALGVDDPDDDQPTEVGMLSLDTARALYL